jgi:aspartyl-tRNA(Asn)/glutamyl-tRNA(Gln) amidotransferase subunit C
MITREDIKKLAELSLIDVSDSELDTLAGEIDPILGYVSEVTTLATDDASREKPELYNVMRDDVVTHEPRQYTEALLAEAPDRDGDYLRVKKIL